MSLRRSARARVPASDPDASMTSINSGTTTPTSAEKMMKRKRSTMTPETSQSPGKAGGGGESPTPNHDNNGGGGSSTSPTIRQTSNRKIVVRNVRGPRPLSEVKDVSGSVPEANGVETISSMDLKTELVDESDDEELQDLYMGEDDKRKLETVLKIYAPELLHKKVDSASRKQSRSFLSLQQALSQAQCSIRSVRNHLLALRAPLIAPPALRAHLSSSYISPPKEDVEKDRKRLSTITMILAIVDEIGIRARKVAGRMDNEGLLPKSKQIGQDEYALHMRLPSGDYFTNAVRLSKRQAIQLDSGYSKIVSVATQPISLDTRPPPTFKERLHPIIPRRKTIPPGEIVEEDVSKPVSHLYYGPWSSFAPTYDSFDGNMTMKASCALWRAKRDDRKTLERMLEEPPSQRELLEETLATLRDVDAEVVLREYDGMKGEPDLQQNARLIEKLDRLQDQRWKRTFARRMLDPKASDDDEPSQEEREVASEIVDTLTQLLSDHSGALAGLIPDTHLLRAASTSVCIDPALMDGVGEPGYWGSLNESLYGPDSTRRVAGARSIPVKPPGAIRDNETIRMDSANEEKVSVTVTQSGSMVKGKGLLDRFAQGRQYSLEDHPHDRKLFVAGSQQQQPPPPPSSTVNQPVRPPPMNNQSMTPYRNAMSPPKASTPPVRPLHAQMRPSPGTPTASYMQQSPQQQQQHQTTSSPSSFASKNMPYYRPAPLQSHSQSPRGGWPQMSAPLHQQQQQAHSFYPTMTYPGRPQQDHPHRYLSGSPL